MKTVLLAFVAATSTAHAQQYRAVWAAGPNDVWAAGENGAIGHGSSQSWTTVNSGVTATLRGVWGSAANDVWIVGEGGTILRWNGTAVRPVQPPVRADFIDVDGCGPNDVYVLGQSEDDRQPPPLFRWNGSMWAPQALGVAFRATEIALTCTAVQGAGAGGGSVVVVGATYFDPRPTERRTVGVVARTRGGQWVTEGWNGRAITDSTLGGHGWTHVASNGGVTLLAGGDSGNVLLLSGRTGWTRLPAPPAEFERIVVTGAGSPVLVMQDGFARLVQGQWRMVGGPPQQQAAPSANTQAEIERLQQRMSALGEQIQRAGGMPTAAQMQELQALSMRMMALQTGQSPDASLQELSQGAQAQGQQALAAAQRQMTLQFASQPGVFAPRTGADFYVSTRNAAVMHVTGEQSRIVYSMACQSAPQLCR